jgi:hypothetical protein
MPLPKRGCPLGFGRDCSTLEVFPNTIYIQRILRQCPPYALPVEVLVLSIDIYILRSELRASGGAANLPHAGLEHPNWSGNRFDRLPRRERLGKSDFW